MKRIAINLTLILPLMLLGCSSPKENDPNNKNIVMKNDELTIINFADIQMDSSIDLRQDGILNKTIKSCIEKSNPDLILLSGDNAWGENTLSCYTALCQYLDNFEIPYFLVLGNHDRENASADKIMDTVNNSKYGYIEKGIKNSNTIGNYVLSIKNKNKELIHKIFMMDSRDYREAKEEDYKYVTEPAPGMIYAYRNDKPYYGKNPYDTIRDEQIDWYKSEAKKDNVESTLITHMPIREYAYAYENYLKAKASGNQKLIDSMEPIGPCRLFENIACSVKDYGLFNVIKEIGSTKNIICGHDHNNDYSLLYKGIRLTFAVKTGDECYWVQDGSMNGCTEIKIDSKGNASLTQHYISVKN